MNNREDSIRVSLERLSSGLRVNRASDDAVILSLSSRIKQQLSSVSTAVDNINDSLLIIRAVDTALSKIGSLLTRVRDLILKLSNDAYTDLDREIFKNEVNQLLSEIDVIAKSTKYNTKSLLDGGFSRDILFLEGREYIEDFYLSYPFNSTCEISVKYRGETAEIALPFRTAQSISLSTSLYSALEESVSGEYIKTLYITSNNKTVEVGLIVSSTGGDTISSAIDKLNSAFLENEIEVTASYDSVGKRIILSSNEVGSRYQIDIRESNSIEDARSFSNIYELSALTGTDGSLSYQKLLYIDGAIKGSNVNGGTLVRDYFGSTSGITFTFTGSLGRTVTIDVLGTYTLDYTSLLIRDRLRTELNIDVNVTFSSTLDRFVFTYSNPDTRLEVDIAGGVHSEMYETIEAKEDTLLGDVLALQNELTLTFFDENGFVADLRLNGSNTVNDLIDAINNLDIGVIASYSDGKILIDQSGREFKIYKVEQTGSDIFYVERRAVFLGYPTLRTAEDIVLSINDRIYTFDSRYVRLDWGSFTLTRDFLQSLAKIKFQVVSGWFIISLGKETIDLMLPVVTLRSLGLEEIDFSDRTLLDKVSNAIDIVSRERARMGGLENTLKGIVQQKDFYKQNLTEAEARMLLLEVEKEISNLTKDKLLMLLGNMLAEDICSLLKEIYNPVIKSTEI
ncbi:hypothetical protein H5T89_02310 [bacterium]|nr:hypothetical protein [bacterium]